jgi:xylan 1,4-beta-xylosidase
MASANETTASVLLWNYHDLNKIKQPTSVNVIINNIKAKAVTLFHYRIDNEHSNSYEVWKAMGSPQNPTTEQYNILEKSGKLQLMEEPKQLAIDKDQLTIPVNLPSQAVSLLVIEWNN